MITAAVAMLGVVAMLAFMSTSDPRVRDQFMREVLWLRERVWEWHLVTQYPARHRTDGTGRPNWVAVSA